MKTTTAHQSPPDWQVVQIWPGFVVEVNCSGGERRRRYTDDRIEPMA